MDILKRFFGEKKKQSFADNDSFMRLQTEEMEAIMGGRPTGQAAASLDMETDKMGGRTTQSDYASPGNRH